MVFTNDGKNEIRNWLAGDSVTEPTHVACGTGTTNPLAIDSDMESETHRNAIASTTKTDKQLNIECVFDSTEANGNDITEVGVVNASSGTSGGGVTLFSRDKHTAITKSSSVELQYNLIYQIT